MAREKQTREKMLSFRVTPSEYNYYTAKAAEEGLNLSTLVRIALIAYLRDK